MCFIDFSFYIYSNFFVWWARVHWNEKCFGQIQFQLNSRENNGRGEIKVKSFRQIQFQFRFSLTTTTFIIMRRWRKIYFQKSICWFIEFESSYSSLLENWPMESKPQLWLFLLWTMTLAMDGKVKPTQLVLRAADSNTPSYWIIVRKSIRLSIRVLLRIHSNWLRFWPQLHFMVLLRTA